MTLVNSLITKGINSTLQLSKGTNLSYQSTGVAVYTSTEIDRWHIGDFISADYIINAEYGQNERETIHATLVATPGQSAVTIFGRTNLNRPLLNVRSQATDSYVTLIVEPATTSVQGSIINFFANYAKASLPVRQLNSSATARQTSWSTTNSAVTTLTITVPTSNITGSILVGQQVTNSKLPAFSQVTSWNSLSGQLSITWDVPTNIFGSTNENLKFSSPLTSSDSNVSTEKEVGFRSILIPGHDTVDATVENDFVIINPGQGIELLSSNVDKSITISSQAITRIAVPGDLPIDTTLSGSTTLNVINGSGISLLTDTLTNSLTITSNGVEIFADDGSNTSGLQLTFVGGQGVVTEVVNNTLQITNTSLNYTILKDDSSNTASPDSFNTTLRIRQGAGISATITSNDNTYGDNLLITNTGVLNIAGKTGAITQTSLISTINDAQNAGIYITQSLPSVAMMFFLRAV